jgi:bifunctional DNase/RNase
MKRVRGEPMNRWHLALPAAAWLILSPPCGPAAWAAEDGVEIQEVQVRLLDQGPVVLLIVGDRFVPIHIDLTVAVSIVHALSGGASPRPLSHDLMRLMLLEMGAKVTRAVITLKDKTYYADLTVALGDRTLVFDSRSSDAIALAVLFKAPIVVVKPTWESAGQPWTEPKRETS